MAGETIIVRQGLRGIKGDKGDPGAPGRDGTGVVPSAGQVVAGGASGSTVDLASGQYPKGDGTNVVAGDFAADVANAPAVVGLGDKTPWLAITPSMSTATIQGEIDTLAASGGGQALFQANDYNVDTLILKSNVHLVTPGKQATRLNANASAAPGLLQIDQAGGPVTRLSVGDFTLTGNAANTTQWALYITPTARTVSPFDGGLWYSEFGALSIRNFSRGIWLRGGGSSNLLPHQFLKFGPITLQPGSASSTGWLGLVISGMVGQVSFDVLEVTGSTAAMDAQYALWVLRECNDSFANLSDAHPYALTFDAPTFQGAALAARVDRAESVLFLAPWFEDNKSAILAENAATVTVVSPQFHDTGANGSGTGYVARVDSGAFLTITDPTIAGAVDANAYQLNTASGALNVVRPGAGGAVHTASGNPRTITAAATVVAGNNPYVIIQGATTVNTITTYLGPDDTLTVRAGSDLTFGTTGNLRFIGFGGPTGAATAYTASSGSVLVFKIDRVANVLYLIASDSPGSVRKRVVTVTASTTLTDAHDSVRVDASAGAVTLTLPVASGRGGKRITVVKTDSSANVVTIQRAGSDTVNYGSGTNTTLTTQNAKVTLEADGGTVWSVVG